MNEKRHPHEYTLTFTSQQVIGLILAFCVDDDDELTPPERLLIEDVSAVVRGQLVAQNFAAALDDDVWWHEHSPNFRQPHGEARSER